MAPTNNTYKDSYQTEITSLVHDEEEVVEKPFSAHRSTVVTNMLSIGLALLVACVAMAGHNQHKSRLMQLKAALAGHKHQMESLIVPVEFTPLLGAAAASLANGNQCGSGGEC